MVTESKRWWALALLPLLVPGGWAALAGGGGGEPDG